MTNNIDRDWLKNAIGKIQADNHRSAETHLLHFQWPTLSHVDIYLKDESTHPTGSLKHRLARSLFIYALCNGWLNKNTPVIEASSGSTAVSEAYFAKLIGVRFIAVMPKSTSSEKIKQITFYGGECHFVDSSAEIYEASENLAKQLGGHYMDQFTYAERATDWRGNNNIAESIFHQLENERYPIPTWFVMSAGTGGTSSTIGRYIRYHNHSSKLCVADPQNSVFYDYYKTSNKSLTLRQGSKIEGIGRPRVEPSFMSAVIDRMEKVPDNASIACVQMLDERLQRKCGGSTGTNLYATLKIAAEMQKNDEKGSIVSLICDSGERYLQTYFNNDWLIENNLDPKIVNEKLSRLRAGDCDALL